MRSPSFLVLYVSFFLTVAYSASGQSLLTSDFGINVTSADDLVFTGLRNLPESAPGTTEITFANLASFPVLAGQGLSGAVVKFGPKAINTLHSHPRGSELFLVISGSLLAGIVDTSNRLLTKTIYAGDVIVFPIGLTHFQVNFNNETATAFAAFSNPNAGRITVAQAIFNSNPRIDAGFLEQALALDAATVDRLLTVPFPADGGPQLTVN